MKYFHNPFESELNKSGIFWLGTYFGLLLAIFYLGIRNGITERGYILLNISLWVFVLSIFWLKSYCSFSEIKENGNLEK